MTTVLKVFLASPGDVPREREALPRVIDEVNLTIGPLKDCRLEAMQALAALWGRMSPDLQQAMSVAYNENRLRGDPGIQTRDLFAALLRLDSPSLRPLVEEIPAEALPPPTTGTLIDTTYITTERPWLSGCVASSVKRLSKALPRGRLLTAADVFADIAKNGTGASVILLRKHHIGPEEIDRILKQKKIDVIAG